MQRSTLQDLRTGFLNLLPVNMTLDLYEKYYGTSTDKGNFKKFIDELKQGLVVRGATPDFIAAFIPEYINLCWKEKLKLGQIYDYHLAISAELDEAYDPATPKEKQDQCKVHVFNAMLLKVGPHGKKRIQTLRAQDPKSWIGSAIAIFQSDLPGPTTEQFIEKMKKGFLDGGGVKYAEDANEELLETKDGLGTGTVGSAFEVIWKEANPPRSIVVKIPHDNIISQFIEDGRIVEQAIDNLIKKGEVSKSTAIAFKYFSKKRLEAELREANPTAENMSLTHPLYEAPGISTVKVIKELVQVSKGLVIMEKAKGVKFTKHMNVIRKDLANYENLSPEEQKKTEGDLRTIREGIVDVIKLTIKKMMHNEEVHGDPHEGNILVGDGEIIMIDPTPVNISDPAEHLRLRQFLFAIHLTAGTADTYYLQQYYATQHHSTHDAFKVATDEMLVSIQEKLNEIKQGSLNKTSIDVDNMMAEIMGLIGCAALTGTPEIIPSALDTLSRTTSALSELFEGLKQDEAYLPFLKLPYFERTLMGLNLKIALENRDMDVKELWTDETWTHFCKNWCRSENGEGQIQFEKKFIYGIFGLSDTEAGMADKSPIAVGVAIALGAKVLGKTITTMKKMKSTLPTLADSYVFLKTWRHTYGSQASVQSIFSKIQSVMPDANSAKNFKAAGSKFQQAFFEARAKLPLPAGFLRGMLVGGALVGYGAHKHLQKSEEKKMRK